MGARQKQRRFKEITENPYVLEYGKEEFEAIRGNWNKDFFKNDNKIVLELGCGKGEYTIGLSRLYPDKNFIGVDIKGDRIWYGSGTAREEKLSNVAFLRTQILLIEKFFEKGEVDEIWITFPDPRMKDSDVRRRLVSPRFLALYKTILKDGGVVHLKTDDFALYDYSHNLVQEMNLNVLIATDNLYESHALDDHHGLQTTYERMYLERGKKINYLRFEL